MYCKSEFRAYALSRQVIMITIIVIITPYNNLPAECVSTRLRVAVHSLLYICMYVCIHVYINELKYIKQCYPGYKLRTVLSTPKRLSHFPPF